MEFFFFFFFGSMYIETERKVGTKLFSYESQLTTGKSPAGRTFLVKVHKDD